MPIEPLRPAVGPASTPGLTLPVTPPAGAAGAGASPLVPAEGLAAGRTPLPDPSVRQRTLPPGADPRTTPAATDTPSTSGSSTLPARHAIPHRPAPPLPILPKQRQYLEAQPEAQRGQIAQQILAYNRDIADKGKEQLVARRKPRDGAPAEAATGTAPVPAEAAATPAAVSPAGTPAGHGRPPKPRHALPNSRVIAQVPGGFQVQGQFLFPVQPESSPVT